MDDSRAPWSRATALASCALLVFGAIALFLEEPFWWFGIGALSAALVLLRGWPAWRTLRRLAFARIGTRLALRSPARWLLDAVSIVFLVCVSLAMLGDVALGDRPVSHDHTQHFVNTSKLAESIAQGKLFGWSQDAFAGYPVSYLYPIGPQLWVLAFSLLPIDFESAYAIAFFAFFLLSGYSVFRFGREFAGRGAGVLAALFYMTDTGAFRYGGWSFAVEWGVWPQNLSVALTTLALSFVPRLIHTRRWLPLAVVALLGGAALLTHPTAFITLTLGTICCTLAIWLRSNAIPPLRVGIRLMVAMGLAFGIGALWLIPFFSLSKFRLVTAGAGKSAYEFGADLVSGSLFPGTWVYVAAFGLVGFIAGLRSQKPLRLFVSLMILALWCALGASMIAALNLADVWSLFKAMQYERMAILLKPFWFVCAASALIGTVELVAPARAFVELRLGRMAALVFVTTALLSPLLAGFVGEYQRQFVRRHLELESRRELRSERKALVGWAKRNFPRDAFYRVGLFGSDQHDHSLGDLAVELNLPIYKEGFTPASAYRYYMGSTDPAALTATDVRFVISKRPLNGQHFRKLAQFGGLEVYEFTGYTGKPFDVLDGTADVRVLRFEDELIELVVGSGSHGTLRLHVSDFPLWKARRDGKEIELSSLPVPGVPESALLTTRLRPGHYRFEFVQSVWVRLAAIIATLALLGVGLLALADFRVPLAGRVRSFLEGTAMRLETLAARMGKLLRWPGFAFALAVPVLALVLAARVPRVPDLEKNTGTQAQSVAFDAVDRLVSAEVAVAEAERPERCDASFGRFVCTDSTNPSDKGVARVRPLVVEHWVASMPPKKGWLEIRYRDVDLADGLVGFFGLDYRARSGEGRIRIDVDRKTVYDRTERDPSQHYWFAIPSSRVTPRPGRGHEVTVYVYRRGDDVETVHFVLQSVRGRIPIHSAQSDELAGRRRAGD